MGSLERKIRLINQRLGRIKKGFGDLTKQLSSFQRTILEPKVDRIGEFVLQILNELGNKEEKKLLKKGETINKRKKVLTDDCLQKKAVIKLERIQIFPNINQIPNVDDLNLVEVKPEIFDPPLSMESSESTPSLQDLNDPKEEEDDYSTDLLNEIPEVNVPEPTPRGNNNDSSEDEWMPAREKRVFLRNKRLPRVKPIFTCTFPDCGKIFLKPYALKDHELTHRVGEYICQECGHLCKSEASLTLHLKRLHRPLKCTQCPKTFLKLESLELHERKHYEAAICEHCGLEMPKLDLYMHVYTNHREDKQLKCKLEGCTLIFTKPGDLNKHQEEAHQNSIICEHCGSSFFTESTLNIHLKRRHQFVHFCDFEGCSRKFPKNQRLEFERHKAQHELRVNKQIELKNSDGLTFPCNLCDKIYGQLQSLTYHKSTAHVDSFNFPCDYPGCDKRFKSKKNMIQHQQRHQEGSPCEFCQKEFGSVGRLKEHIKNVHKKERNFPFKCGVEGCEESYFRQKYLDLHMEKKHG